MNFSKDDELTLQKILSEDDDLLMKMPPYNFQFVNEEVVYPLALTSESDLYKVIYTPLQRKPVDLTTTGYVLVNDKTVATFLIDKDHKLKTELHCFDIEKGEMDGSTLILYWKNLPLNSKAVISYEYDCSIEG